jgi:hypothetical protein
MKTTIKKSTMLKLSHLLPIVFSCVSLNAYCQDYEITNQQLGKLSINVSSVKSVDTYRGVALSAQVTSQSGAAYTMTAPMNVQRVIFLKPRGTSVQAGETVVKLIGSEVEHYHDEYELKKDLFAQASKLYENNRKLYQQEAIGEQQWLSISEYFVTQKLEFGEFQHFFEYVDKYDHDEQSLSLKSPVNGMLNFDNFASIATNQAILNIIPQQAIQIKINLPSSQVEVPSAVFLASCSLKVESTEGLSQSFYKTVWSEPLKPACNLRYGDITTVHPQYSLSAYRVPKTSVFSLHGEHYILIKQADGFVSTQVSIVSSEQNDFIVTSAAIIEGASAASSSVSALQGILMGLGE